MSPELAFAIVGSVLLLHYSVFRIQRAVRRLDEVGL